MNGMTKKDESKRILNDFVLLFYYEISCRMLLILRSYLKQNVCQIFFFWQQIPVVGNHTSHEKKNKRYTKEITY